MDHSGGGGPLIHCINFDTAFISNKHRASSTHVDNVIAPSIEACGTSVSFDYHFAILRHFKVGAASIHTDCGGVGSGSQMKL